MRQQRMQQMPQNMPPVAPDADSTKPAKPEAKKPDAKKK